MKKQTHLYLGVHFQQIFWQNYSSKHQKTGGLKVKDVVQTGLDLFYGFIQTLQKKNL